MCVDLLFAWFKTAVGTDFRGIKGAKNAPVIPRFRGQAALLALRGGIRKAFVSSLSVKREFILSARGVPAASFHKSQGKSAAPEQRRRIAPKFHFFAKGE